MPQYTDGIRLEIFEWQRIDAPPATDVSIAADFTPWVVGTEPDAGGYRVLRRRGRAWIDQGVAATRIEVDPRGVPWVITDDGRLLTRRDDAWEDTGLPGIAVDCSAGLGGVVWAVSADDAGSGATRLLRFHDGSWTSDLPPAAPVVYPHAIPWTASDDDTYGMAHAGEQPLAPRLVATMADGLPWVVDGDGTHYRRLAGGWQRMPDEPAADLDISIGGNVWILGEDRRDGGTGPWRYYHGTDWDAHEGAGTRIAVGADGLPWMVDAAGRLFRHHVKL